MSNYSSPTTTLTAVSAGTVKWVEDGLVGAFTSPRGYCVRKGATYLSFDGARPSVWGRKSTATIIADTIVDDGSLVWVPAAP